MVPFDVLKCFETSSRRIPKEKMIPSTITLQQKEAKTTTHPQPPSGGIVYDEDGVLGDRDEDDCDGDDRLLLDECRDDDLEHEPNECICSNAFPDMSSSSCSSACTRDLSFCLHDVERSSRWLSDGIFMVTF